ncbi:hypothetical protein EW145_g5765 [Phellinidium pouzarii]|uniref:Uncharacterized protein n=1 Tax=Phellinidium pouzarii TaxID=167371 RepID=A0A4S4KZH7_9AGAM|nr:hypothetical protein EW145_g5765 [Phellinidium pouzarii]
MEVYCLAGREVFSPQLSSWVRPQTAESPFAPPTSAGSGTSATQHVRAICHRVVAHHILCCCLHNAKSEGRTWSRASWVTMAISLLRCRMRMGLASAREQATVAACPRWLRHRCLRLGIGRGGVKGSGVVYARGGTRLERVCCLWPLKVCAFPLSVAQTIVTHVGTLVRPAFAPTVTKEHDGDAAISTFFCDGHEAGRP